MKGLKMKDIFFPELSDASLEEANEAIVQIVHSDEGGFIDKSNYTHIDIRSPEEGEQANVLAGDRIHENDDDVEIHILPSQLLDVTDVIEDCKSITKLLYPLLRKN